MRFGVCKLRNLLMAALKIDVDNAYIMCDISEESETKTV